MDILIVDILKKSGIYQTVLVNNRTQFITLFTAKHGDKLQDSTQGGKFLNIRKNDQFLMTSQRGHNHLRLCSYFRSAPHKRQFKK
jgi:hypothetical protein